MIDREYEYRLKAGRVMTRAMLYGAGAIFFAYMALTNDRGLVLFVIPLNQSRATLFYGIFAALAALFSAADVVNVQRRESLRQRIAFSPDGLLVPRSDWTAEEKLIPYESILELHPFNEPDSLIVIRHQSGEFSLRLDMLADERTYAEVVQELALRIRASRSEPAGEPDTAQASP